MTKIEGLGIVRSHNKTGKLGNGFCQKMTRKKFIFFHSFGRKFFIPKVKALISKFLFEEFSLKLENEFA